VTVLIVSEVLSRSSFAPRVLAWSERSPTAFGALLFLRCLDITTNFSSIRWLMLRLSGHTDKLVMSVLGAPV